MFSNSLEAALVLLRAGGAVAGGGEDSTGVASFRLVAVLRTTFLVFCNEVLVLPASSGDFVRARLDFPAPETVRRTARGSGSTDEACLVRAIVYAIGFPLMKECGVVINGAR